MKAFPTTTDNGHAENQDGMNLRDYFAAKALQGLIAGCYAGNNAGFTVEGNVFAAYEYADAMMKARDR
jgi:hypothetical protein